jgi:predicted alpha/beta-hydrolase family hydrolase
MRTRSQKDTTQTRQSEKPDVNSRDDTAIKTTKKNDRKNREEVTISNTDVATAAKVSFQIPFKGKDKQIPCQMQGGDEGDKPALIFTHGAGGGLHNAATQDFASGFAETAPVLLFQGTMNLPNRIKAFENVIEHAESSGALGGRSMGARAAGTIAATNEETKAVVLVSYPLVGKGDDVRDDILLNIPKRVDVLFMIGSEDNMCPLDMLADVRAKMTARSWLVTVRGADHGMGVKKKDGESEAIRRRTGAVAAAWLQERDANKRSCSIYRDADAGQVVSGKWQKDDEVGKGNEDAEPEKKKRKVG